MHFLEINDRDFYNVSNPKHLHIDRMNDEVYLEGRPLVKGSELPQGVTTKHFVKALIEWITTAKWGIKTPLEVIAYIESKRKRSRKKKPDTE